MAQETKSTKTVAAFAASEISLQANGMADPVVIDTGKLPTEILAHLVAFGLKELTNNALASAKKNEWSPEERVKKVQEKVAALMAGEWTMRSSGGGSSLPADPVQREAHKLAYSHVRGILDGRVVPQDNEEIASNKGAFMEQVFLKVKDGKPTEDTITGAELVAKLSAHESIQAQAKRLADAKSMKIEL